MRRLARWLLNVLTMLSLLLCVAAIIMSFAGDTFLGTTPVGLHADRATFVSSDKGALRFWSLSVSPPPPSGVGITFLPQAVNVFDAAGQEALGSVVWEGPVAHPEHGFSVHARARVVSPLATGGRYGYTVRYDSIFVAWWLIALAFTLPPLGVAAIKRIRRARRRAGLCGKCAYDLTGNVSGICPECGTKICSSVFAQSTPAS